MTLVKQCQLLGNIFSVLKIKTCLTVTGNGNFTAAMTIDATEANFTSLLRLPYGCCMNTSLKKSLDFVGLPQDPCTKS